MSERILAALADTRTSATWSGAAWNIQGLARPSRTRLGEEGRGEDWPGRAGLGLASRSRLGAAGPGLARRARHGFADTARLGWGRNGIGTAGPGFADEVGLGRGRQGMAILGVASRSRRGAAWTGSARHGFADVARQCGVWRDAARRGRTGWACLRGRGRLRLRVARGGREGSEGPASRSRFGAAGPVRGWLGFAVQAWRGTAGSGLARMRGHGAFW
jgi:hypothetical protein